MQRGVHFAPRVEIHGVVGTLSVRRAHGWKNRPQDLRYYTKMKILSQCFDSIRYGKFIKSPTVLVIWHGRVRQGMEGRIKQRSSI